ncbi:hypothetical protein PybrP1_009186 [[Pythium] brassicae (nom. inval.)]|nr:hypothetical protein PybrP1_009186 [[Pythium] brassicae (nom. inval.)]
MASGAMMALHALLPSPRDGANASPSLDGSCAARGVSIPHLSFATDLLFNLEDVKLHCNQGLSTQSQLVAMLRSRVALEKHYANELMRLAQQSQLEELERGTTREALGKLKAQYLNTSVQHRVLAESLEEDVLKPIEELHAINSQKAQHLHKTLNGMKKQAKAQEDAYRKDFGAFEKQFRETAATFAAAMDAGFSSTAIELQYHQQLMQHQTEADPQYAGDATSSKPKGAVALQSSFNNNSQKLVNWLLASDQHRKDNLCSSAANALESRIDMYRALQSVMTDYQHIAEERIANFTTNLRKHVIFESSALANEQYDWQMIAGKIESVDAESDLRDYILIHHHLHDLPSMTVSDLCYSPLATAILPSPTAKPCHPLKRVPIEIGDVAMRRIPLDYDGNQESLAQILVTRASTTVKIHPVALAHEPPAATSSPASLEAVQFDQLRIDCSAPPAARRSLAELQEEAKTSLRVAPAQEEQTEFVSNDDEADDDELLCDSHER